MTDMRFIVSWGTPTGKPEDRFSNTLYFVSPNITGIDYQALANDLRDIYASKFFTTGCKIEVRAYQMSDDKPRPERAFSTVTKTGTFQGGPPQIALCLSYYSQRNLPRQRGRIYIGPWPSPSSRPTQADRDLLIALGNQFAGLGGLDIDWSVFSPTKAALGQDPTMSISDIWVDDSWDVIRSRKLAATTRSQASVNE